MFHGFSLRKNRKESSFRSDDGLDQIRRGSWVLFFCRFFLFFFNCQGFGMKWSRPGSNMLILDGGCQAPLTAASFWGLLFCSTQIQVYVLRGDGGIFFLFFSLFNYTLFIGILLGFSVVS